MDLWNGGGRDLQAQWANWVGPILFSCNQIATLKGVGKLSPCDLKRLSLYKESSKVSSGRKRGDLSLVLEGLPFEEVTLSICPLHPRIGLSSRLTF